MADIERKLSPVQAEVRRRLGNFILAEDDQTLEGVILATLAERGASLAVVETFTGGQIAARIAHLPGAEKIFRRGIAARDLAQLGDAVGLRDASPEAHTPEHAVEIARAARSQTGATHALAVLIDLDDGADRIDFGATIDIVIATEDGAATRRSRILGGRDWVRLGAVEMGLDCLRRHLQGLPVDEKIDFEKV